MTPYYHHTTRLFGRPHHASPDKEGNIKRQRREKAKAYHAEYLAGGLLHKGWAMGGELMKAVRNVDDNRIVAPIR